MPAHICFGGFAQGVGQFHGLGALPGIIGKANRLLTRMIANYGRQTAFVYLTRAAPAFGLGLALGLVIDTLVRKA